MILKCYFYYMSVDIDRQNKLISNYPINSEVAFVSCSHFTVQGGSN